MSTTDGAPGAFTIIQQEHLDEPDENGRMSGVWKITFHTPANVESYVRIPDTHYTADNVAALISEKAGEIARVAALGS